MRSGCSLAGELGWLSSQETPPRGVGLGGAGTVHGAPLVRPAPVLRLAGPPGLVGGISPAPAAASPGLLLLPFWAPVWTFRCLWGV